MDINSDYIYTDDGKETIYESLLSLIYLKDRYTGWHCKNVADLAITIGKRAGIEEEHMPLLYTSALLHDIGKVMVDSAYLLKSGPLTDEEFAEMKKHPVEGKMILDIFSTDKTIVDAALHHHERWDGNGYPDGLRKRDISLVSRIICVADSYDAMAGKRPYKEPMTPQQIKGEFIKAKGRQFDPYFADIMLDLLKEKAGDYIFVPAYS